MPHPIRGIFAVCRVLCLDMIQYLCIPIVLGNLSPRNFPRFPPPSFGGRWRPTFLPLGRSLCGRGWLACPLAPCRNFPGFANGVVINYASHLTMPQDFLRETQRKIRQRRKIPENLDISLGKHKGKTAGGGNFLKFWTFSLGKHKGKAAGGGEFLKI